MRICAEFAVADLRIYGPSEFACLQHNYPCTHADCSVADFPPRHTMWEPTAKVPLIIFIVFESKSKSERCPHISMLSEEHPQCKPGIHEHAVVCWWE